jgi:hypothetical protein
MGRLQTNCRRVSALRLPRPARLPTQHRFLALTHPCLPWFHVPHAPALNRSPLSPCISCIPSFPASSLLLRPPAPSSPPLHPPTRYFCCVQLESASVEVDDILRDLLNGRVDTVEFSG